MPVTLVKKGSIQKFLTGCISSVQNKQIPLICSRSNAASIAQAMVTYSQLHALSRTCNKTGSHAFRRPLTALKSADRMKHPVPIPPRGVIQQRSHAALTDKSCRDASRLPRVHRHRLIVPARTALPASISAGVTRTGEEGISGKRGLKCNKVEHKFATAICKDVKL